MTASNKPILLLAAILGTLPAPGTASADTPGVPLTSEQLEELVTGKTAECRKEKDHSTCVTYFDQEGRVVQVLDGSRERSEGSWFLDDADRLCILWVGRIRPLCFQVDAAADGSYRMIRKSKHLSSITVLVDGNRDGL